MPIYEHKCTNCDARTETYLSDRDDKPLLDSNMENTFCQWCNEIGLKPVYSSVQFGTVTHEYYNPSLGKVVSDQRQVRHEASRLAEDTERRTGIKTNFVEADLSDSRALGVTDEGLAATADAGVKVHDPR